MKKALAAVLSLSLLFTATACGGNASGGETKQEGAVKEGQPVKLRIAWWGGQARHDYTLKVIEMYEKANPHVDIEAEYASFDDYWKKLAPQAAANQLPDIIQMDISYLTQYGGRNQLEDLEAYTKNGQLDVSSVSPNTLSGGQLDGKLFALPLGVNALASVMDMEMIKKAGVATPIDKNWTWTDLDNIAQKMKENGKYIASYKHEVFFPYYLRTVGQKLYSDDGASIGYTDDKPFIDYFTRYQKWYDAGYLLPLDKEATKKGVPEDDEMVMGNSISANGWSNAITAYSAAANRPLELHPLPGPDNQKGMYLKPSMYFSITKNSKVKEEAAKFMSYFINDVEANKLIKAERGVPVSSKVKEALRPTLNEAETKLFDYVAWAEENSSPMDPPSPVGAIEVEKLLKDINEQILYKKITVQAAAEKFRKEANAVLAKNKK
ncbi:ABC transporter substrate-binding protein [Paenibacillus puerhi]|uniref:ABC transporter substrate-binding protein n=1 Tax=Paenibacillus puerhi TaxID=2692622 RepID=UPI00135B84F8|nr:extracellular solute-binding protein [Paenibacillus puerhi]